MVLTFLLLASPATPELKIRWYIYLMAIFSVIATPIYAQLRMPPVNALNKADFQQHLNVYDWHYVLGQGGKQNNFSYSAGVDLSISLTKRGQEKKWKDDQKGMLYLLGNARPNLLFITRFAYNHFRDDLSSFNYERNKSSGTIGARWQVNPMVSLQSDVGYRWEERQDFFENGPYGALSFDISNLNWAGYEHNIRGFGEITRYADRKNTNNSMQFSVFRQFGGGTKDSLVAFYQAFRRDNFLPNFKFSDIESLRKSTRGISNFLTYGVSESAVLLLNTRFSMDAVSVARMMASGDNASRKHDDFDFLQQARFIWNMDKWQTGFELTGGQASVKYSTPDSARRSPFSQRFSTLGYDLQQRSTRFRSRISRLQGEKHIFHLSFDLSKLQHDNSNTVKSDSYDEQMINTTFRHRIKINSGLQVSWELGTFLKHFVYIDQQLSAGNNWKRVIQFIPKLDYEHSERLKLKQVVGVRTQFVDFDFDIEGFQTRSYVIRDFFLYDSLAFQISKSISGKLEYRMELEELGSLNWTSFSSSPRSMLQNQWLEFSFSQKLNLLFEVQIGAMFYKQSRWQFVTREGVFEKELNGTQVNFGPRVRFLYAVGDGSFFLFQGHRQKAYPMQGDAYFVDSFQLTMQWQF